MSNVEKIADVTEVNQLISLGKEKGYLTYEEVNDVLPANLVAPEQIDDLMHIFGENEIEIVDTAAKGDKSVELETDKEEEPAPEESVPAAKPDNVTIDDPVRMYLREMGTISLLTREGEVEIVARKCDQALDNRRTASHIQRRRNEQHPLKGEQQNRHLMFCTFTGQSMRTARFSLE